MTSKIALVTGAGSGIGRAAALGLAQSGFSVVLAGRREAPLVASEQEIVVGGGVALAIPCDVTDPAAVDELFTTVVHRFGRLDLLFNNAGVSARGVPMDELSVDDWRKVIDTNLTGAFLCLRAAFRQMKSQSPMGGRIINNGSISAHTPRPNSAPYTASKHAITGLTKSAALDGRSFNIACGQIDIGNAATDMAAAMTRGMPQADGQIRSEPVMDVQLVGDAIVYMASLPPGANAHFLTLMATAMPFVGRG